MVKGRETRTLEAVNHMPVGQVHKAWRRPLTTEGEFGDLLATVLAESSAAKITWNRWDSVNGKRVAVFDYAIDQEHSSLRVSRNDMAHAVLAYSGSVFADPVSGEVWRVTDFTTDAPRELRLKETRTSVDYAETAIGGNRYALPKHATVVNVGFDEALRNEIEFSDYRKFEAESTIKFDTDPGSAPPPPVPQH